MRLSKTRYGSAKVIAMVVNTGEFKFTYNYDGNGSQIAYPWPMSQPYQLVPYRIQNQNSNKRNIVRVLFADDGNNKTPSFLSKNQIYFMKASPDYPPYQYPGMSFIYGFGKLYSNLNDAINNANQITFSSQQIKINFNFFIIDYTSIPTPCNEITELDCFCGPNPQYTRNLPQTATAIIPEASLEFNNGNDKKVIGDIYETLQFNQTTMTYYSDLKNYYNVPGRITIKTEFTYDYNPSSDVGFSNSIQTKFKISRPYELDVYTDWKQLTIYHRPYTQNLNILNPPPVGNHFFDLRFNYGFNEYYDTVITTDFAINYSTTKKLFSNFVTDNAGFYGYSKNKNFYITSKHPNVIVRSDNLI